MLLLFLKAYIIYKCIRIFYTQDITPNDARFNTYTVTQTPEISLNIGYTYIGL